MLTADQSNRLDPLSGVVPRICLQICSKLSKSTISEERLLWANCFKDRQPWLAGSFGVEVARRIMSPVRDDGLPTLIVFNAGFLTETLDVKTSYEAIHGSSLLVYAFESIPNFIQAYQASNASFYDDAKAKSFVLENSVNIFVNNATAAQDDTIPFTIENLDLLLTTFHTYGAESVLICHSGEGSDDSVMKQLYLAFNCTSVTLVLIPATALACVNKFRIVLPANAASDSFTTSYYTGGIASNTLKICRKTEMSTFLSFDAASVRARNNGQFVRMLGNHIVASHDARVNVAYGIDVYNFFFYTLHIFLGITERTEGGDFPYHKFSTVENELGVLEEVRPKARDIYSDYQSLLTLIYSGEVIISGSLVSAHFVFDSAAVIFRDVLNHSRTISYNINDLRVFISSKRVQNEGVVENVDEFLDVAGLFFNIRESFYGKEYDDPYAAAKIEVISTILPLSSHQLSFLFLELSR